MYILPYSSQQVILHWQVIKDILILCFPFKKEWKFYEIYQITNFATKTIEVIK